MLLHVAITKFKEFLPLPFSISHHVFKRQTQTTPPLRLRLYSVKKLAPPSESWALTWKDRNGNHIVSRDGIISRQGACGIRAAAAYLPCPERSSTPSHRRIIKNTVLNRGLTARIARTPLVPSTKRELHEEILRMLSLVPPAPFSRLIGLYQRHPMLQSVESCNLLLHLSIRHSFSRHTQILIRSMALNRMDPNATTEKLIVRHMVTNGHWKQAWQQVMRRYTSMADIPLAVLSELLAPGTRNFPRRRLLPTRRLGNSSVDSRPSFPSRCLDEPLERVEDGTLAFKIPLDTLILILHRFPRLSLNEVARLPPRIVSYAVRGLIRNGHQEPALLLTENHLKSLPSNIPSKRIYFARELVHLHLSSGELKLANYKKRRRLVEYLFSLHPSLHPNARTVFLLMRYMKRSKRCGIEAYLFFKDYRARWGPVIDSLEVRRRIVEYAIKQRKFGIAKEISLQRPLDDPLLSHQSLGPRAQPLATLDMRAWRSLYPRKGKGARFWKRVVIRLLGRRRAWKRRLSRLSRPT